MARAKNLITYAKVNDRNGDLSRTWYVEYSFRLPGSDERYRRRVYDGLGSGTLEQRQKIAADIVEQVNQYLKSGEYLQHDANYNPVRVIDTYRPEQQLYDEYDRKLHITHLIREYEKQDRLTLRASSQQTYHGELMIFREYVVETLGDPCVRNISRQQLIKFFQYLATDKKDGGRGICRKTIQKYKSNIHRLFDYFIDMELIDQNPVYRIPEYGKIIDCSTDLYTSDERTRLRDAILPRQPYLWLACEIMYYCAIRPGTELRLLRVKNINRERKCITIPSDIAKNKNTETVKVPDCVLQLMEQLGVFAYDPECFIWSHTGVPGVVPVGKSTLRYRFQQYRAELGISRDKKFYGWKHTGAISAYDNGASIFEIQDHMRHSDIATTMKYLKKRKKKSGDAEKYIERI